VSVFRPTFTNKKTGKRAQSKIWWYDFLFAGKRIRESAKTTRKTIAIEAEKNRHLEMERALAGLPVEKREARINRVKDVIEAYLKHYPINHREKSVQFARQRLAHVERLLGAALVPHLTEDRIRDYIQQRLDEDAGGRTINMELGELSRAMGNKWSILWPKVRKLEENHEVGRALSPEEEQRLLDAASADSSPNRNPILYTFIRMALATGMRSGEILGLRWYQVDLTNAVITVGRKAKTKAGSGRQIPMNPDIQAVLDMHATWYVDRFKQPIKPEWYVFPGRSGMPAAGQERPLEPTRPLTTIKTSWSSLRETSGVLCRLHDLRHTAATKMAEAGVSESTMLALMGHMSRAMLERYSHIRMAAKREAVMALSFSRTGSMTKPDGHAKEIPKVIDHQLIQ
jgi:integrase